jgi:hypothetical protein
MCQERAGRRRGFVRGREHAVKGLAKPGEP